MSDAFWTSLSANLLAAATLLAVLFHRREANRGFVESKAAIAENTQITQETKATVTNGLTTAVEEIHQTTNSMHDELVKATAQMEYAKGVLAGRAQVQAEQAAKE